MGSSTRARSLFVVSIGFGALFVGGGLWTALFERFSLGATFVVGGWLLIRLSRYGLEVLKEKEEAWPSR